MINFPRTPNSGDIFASSDGSRWQWDTVKWIAIGGAGGGSSYLPIAGGTMLGPLILAGPPTASLEAVTKQYADSSFLTIADAAATYAPIASPLFTGDPKAPTPATSDNDTSIATTAYVKAQNYVTGGPYLLLTGGTISGNLYVNGEIWTRGSGASYSFMDQTTNNQWVWYANGNVTRLYTQGIGDTITITQAGRLWTRNGVSAELVLYGSGTNAGLLVINGEAGNWLRLYNDGAAHITSNGSIYFNPGGHVWIQNSDGGHGFLAQSSGGSYGVLFDDGNTHLNSTGPIWIQGTNFIVTSTVDLQSSLLVRNGATVYGGIYTNGNIQTDAGRVISKRTDDNYAGVCVWNANYGARVMFMAGADLHFGVSDGGGTYIGPTFAHFDANGYFYMDHGAKVTGEFQVTGTCTGGALAVAGMGTFYNAFGNGWLYYDSNFRVWDFQSSNNVYAYRDIVAAGALYTGGIYLVNSGGWLYTPWSFASAGDVRADAVFRHGGVSRGAAIECYSTDWDWMAICIAGGNLLFSPDRGASGVYVTPTGWLSDRRLKDNIRDTEIDALAAIMNTPVRAFTWNDEGISLQPHITDPHVSIGFVSQEVEKTIPSAVQSSPFESDDSLHIIPQNMTPYLVRSIQQLAEQVSQLTARLEALES